MTELAPILLFTYKRAESLKSSLEALQNNFLAKESELYVFSDGPKNENEKAKIEEVRSLLRSVSGFKKVTIKESERNKGLAKSVIEGASEILQAHNKIIVLEDDLLTTPNFLNYMNEALAYYENFDDVFSISGYSFDLKMPKGYPYDVYFTTRSSSWGWGTWKNRWDKIDWTMKKFENTSWTINRILSFNKMGSDLYPMLKKQHQGKIDSWAIRFCFHQYLINGFTAFPKISKVQNIGYGDHATHTSGYNLYKTPMDDTGVIRFHFPSPSLEPSIISQFSNKRGYFERLKGIIYSRLMKF